MNVSCKLKDYLKCLRNVRLEHIFWDIRHMKQKIHPVYSYNIYDI